MEVGNVSIGSGAPPVLIAGPCVIESEEHALKMADDIAYEAAMAKIPFIFKASYDKANRTRHDSFRGPGLLDGLEILKKVKEEVGVPVTSDVHSSREAASAGLVLDLIQIPAFLCRQLDILQAAADSGKPVNVKKGQFIGYDRVRFIFSNLRSFGCSRIMITERGTTFGHDDLVVDFRGIERMRKQYPVVFDASHSLGKEDYRLIFPMVRAAVAFGVDAIFVEVHDNPDEAKCDGRTSLRKSWLADLLNDMKKYWCV